jgi:hypothetical protein
MKLLAECKDVFLTHDWGIDQLERKNHDRVSSVNKALSTKGLKTWFDEEEMEGDVQAKMLDGIDKSLCVVVFITDRYMMKAAGSFVCLCLL